MKETVRRLIRPISSLLLLPAALFAQLGSSSLSGVVSDPSGASLPNADITLTSADQTFSRKTITGTSGSYVLPTLPPGRYQLRVAAAGFVTQETEPFDLSSGQGAALNITMRLATQESKVTVEATAPLLETTSASVGATVSSRQLSELPMLGRSFLNAISLEPGVVPLPPAGSTTNHSPVNQSVMPSIFGQRQKDNNFLLDGVENRDPNLLGVGIYPPPDAIAEMKVDSGVGSAVYGHASGATIDVVTKSGTNQWHGDAWEYLRNNKLDARSFFTPSIGAYHWSQFGGAIGGPLTIPYLVKKQHAWYVYGYYEGVRIHSASNFTTFLATPAQIQGDFSAPGLPQIFDPYTTVQGPGNTLTRSPYPGNKIPQGQINPSASKLAQLLFPAPNLAAGTIPGANYINTGGSVTDGNQWNVRVDHQFGTRDTFFARYTAASNPSFGVSLPTQRGSTTDKLQNIEVSDTHIFTPTFIVTGRYGYIGQDYRTFNSVPAGVGNQAGIDSVFPNWQGMEILPQIVIQGYQGVNFNAAVVGPLRQQTAMGDFHLIKGRHTLEFGGAVVWSYLNLDQLQMNVSFARTQTSGYAANSSSYISGTGDGFASYLIGTPTSASRQIGGARGVMASTAESGYVQDTWRNGKLTINGGLRYDYNSPPVNRLGLGTFDFSSGQYRWDKTNPITGAAANLTEGGIIPDRNNIAPRLGIAYSIAPRLVVRSSAGIFYNSFGSNYVQTAQSERGNWPFNFPQNVAGLNATTPNALFPNVFPGNPQGSTTPTICSQCLNVEKSSSRTPYVTEWTLSMQYQFGGDNVLEAAYFGSKGTKLTAQIIDNTAYAPGPAPFSSRQYFPKYAPYVLNGYNEFGSWYDGLALRFEKRFSHGFNYLVSYTFSKNLDYVDNLSNTVGFATSNPTRFNAKLNKGPAGFDITHVLVVSGMWEIPGRTKNKLVDAVISGWKLGNIITYHSGLPFSAIVFGDYANIGTVGSRYPQYADLVGNPYAGSRTTARWFNTAAFAVPASGTYGRAGRNILRTDSLFNDDLSLSKIWNIRERTRFELRGEFFNLFNHPVFGIPNAFADDNPQNFGAVSSTLNSGRQIQLAAKIHF